MRINNREKFFESVNKELQKNHLGMIYSMVACDISFFAVYNESYGYESGDRLIETTKQRILSFVERFYPDNHCIAGYLGNDDFALFIPLAHNGMDNINEIYDSITEHIHEFFFDRKEKFPLKFGVFAMESFVGAFSGCNAVLMYTRARQALDPLKNDYNSTVSIHDINKWTDYQNNQMIMMEAADALENDEFQFYVQPKYDMQHNVIVGCEALVRWINPSNGVIKHYPDEFIPLFEKNGFITKVDLAIWEGVCVWLHGLIERGVNVLPCSVNVSANDFVNISVADTLYDLAVKYQLPTSLIEVEITESAYAGQFDRVCDEVIKMRAMGFKVLIDDFGSAYSNLNRLASMEFDAIKTDMRFMQEEDVKRAHAIMGFIVNVAHLLDVPVIAEGVETDEHAKQLIANNCFIAQGYNYYKPMPPWQFEELL